MILRKRIYAEYEKQFERRGRFCWTTATQSPLRKPWLPRDKTVAILDLGCGIGETLTGLHAAGYANLTGIDAAEVQLASARKLLPGDISLYQADALEFLRAHKEQYDLIIAYDLIEHFTKDEAIELCDAVFSSLRPGGTFVVKVPNSGCILGMFGRDIDFTHLAGYTDLSLFQLLDATGFEEHRLVENDTSINLRIWRPWKPLTGLGLRPRINILLHKALYWLLGTRPPSCFGVVVEAWTQKPCPEGNANTCTSDCR
jgi:SAM-dependent methyltransferase